MTQNSTSGHLSKEIEIVIQKFIYTAMSIAAYLQ